MFAGRRSELQFLENYYQGEDSRILVLYGRKGVGKTALLKEFARGKNCAYYAARSASGREQRCQWARELAFQGHFMEAFPSYSTLFETCLSPFSASGGKAVLILDEFHHFIKAEPDFMTELVNFKERRGKTSPVLVILCSSASGWVENSMIAKLGRMASSIDALLKIRELKFREIRRIYPGFSDRDAVEIYAALGGYPGLWRSFSQEISAKENLIRFLISQGSRLHEEAALYLAEELRETAVYNTLLAAMASGLTKLNDLFVHTGFSRAKISVYLKNLMELDLVEKVYSFESGGYENTQKGIYRICNSYIRFYFRFLYPYQSALQIMDPAEFFDRYVEPGFGEFLESAYRRICREDLSRECSQTGEWMGKSGRIDIVARRNSGELAAALCRYDVPVTKEDLQTMAMCLGQAKLSPDEILFYAEKGFSENLRETAEQNHLSPIRLFGQKNGE